MDTHALDHQKDPLSSLFSLDDTPQFQYNPQSSLHHTPTPSLSTHINTGNQLDLLGNMIAMHGIESPSPLPQYAPHLLLEQQFKLSQLQQLQQLQNQIFQQQIALISGQPGIVHTEPSPELQRDHPAQFHGLPTPGSSTELRPQQSSDYVSPMILHYVDTPPDAFQNPLENTPSLPQQQQQQQQTQPQFFQPHGFTSAPASMAFDSIPLSTEIDFDISPLTSPWLGSRKQSVAPRHTSNKRTASLSSDESSEKAGRQRPSPAMHPKKQPRPYKSSSSTPVLRTTRSRRSSTNGDTPSPVDLSMPPPAPPSNQAAPSHPSSPSLNPHLTPVTPASIMNLGKFGAGRKLAPENDPSNIDSKMKGVTRPRASTDAPTRNKQSKRIAVSPRLKAILPAGSHPTLNPGGSTAFQPVVQVRKTSHKVAEQKRRDSLKTTFDDLRGLLPPIPLPSDENFPDERILPGALPPRGPPKTGGEGPNKGVSKLQLLMCGNDYIRQLKARVDRRDEEIERLRREILRLRVLVGEEARNEMEEELDLERDLDACELFGVGFRRGGSLVADDEGDDDGED